VHGRLQAQNGVESEQAAKVTPAVVETAVEMSRKSWKQWRLSVPV
jgi:hypothetical protein